ncbi:conjugal transfer protein TrbL family protein [Clostridium sp. ZS2-4]|uniref:conjugal transfer protein TrbL family protein n=1 Tax=Clostridium sp. ZS2-4 TaxID=2987703 RepID=UPI002DD6326C|nr:conjugal transfer protein TrbL family protein [Clostridium sp. ZS2-4]
MLFSFISSIFNERNGDINTSHRVACVGLLDADNGVFRTYIQKFFQSTLAVLVQIVLAKSRSSFNA